MRNINKEDLSFLRALGGTGEKSPVFSFMRKGRILLLIPDQGRRSKEAFELYQPQSLGARWVVYVLKLVTGVFGRPPMLSKLVLKDSGVLCRLCAESGSKIVSVLLGNPNQSGRRAIVWVRDEEGENLIWKVGFSEEARRLVLAEAAFLENQGKREGEIRRKGIPQSLKLIEEDFVGLGLPLYRGEGISPEDNTAVAELLTSWLGDREPEEWSVVAESLEKRMGALPELCLRSSLRHGDFTAWNVIRTNDGLQVIDWEMGHEAGVPGWDLVHWLIQDAQLVRRLKPVATIREVWDLLGKPEFRHFLDEAGWGTRVDLLLASYLAFYEGDESFDTTELFQEFLKERKGGKR